MFGRNAVGVGVLVGAVFLIVAGVLAVAGLLYGGKSHERTAAGTLRYTSLYVPMSDGVRLAVDVALPKDLKSGQKIPALIKGTPYWRAPQLTLLGRALTLLGWKRFLDVDGPFLNRRGYAVITVDTRGTGASFGHVDIMFGDREIRDFGEIIDWAARQDWSNGRLGAYGFSYPGILAADMASLDRPALKAIAPSFDFPDLYLIGHPGGVFSRRFFSEWSMQTAALNRGQLLSCGVRCRLLTMGPERVDADRNGELLAQAIAEHARNWSVYECLRNAPDRGDNICASGESMGEVSEISRRTGIEKSGVPIFGFLGYFDANSPAQALERFRTFSNPQELTLGALSHGGYFNTDPFADAGAAAADPSYAQQTSDMADFFDRYVKADGKPPGKMLRYFVLNGGGWKTTGVWPPAGVKATPWYFAADRTLSTSAPTAEGIDTYTVDFATSSGTLSRYQSPVDLKRTAYPDRGAQDEKLLTYTSAPLDSDVEIAGDPVAVLTLSETGTDGEVIVYLEDVVADGTVKYLTEGPLRLADRKPFASPDANVPSDALHTFLAADAAPMMPGKPESIEIEMSPIAVRLRKGGRIRVAIAGADADNLERIPATGDPTFTIERGAVAGSRVELPQMAPGNAQVAVQDPARR